MVLICSAFQHSSIPPLLNPGFFVYFGVWKIWRAAFQPSCHSNIPTFIRPIKSLFLDPRSIGSQSSHRNFLPRINHHQSPIKMFTIVTSDIQMMSLLHDLVHGILEDQNDRMRIRATLILIFQIFRVECSGMLECWNAERIRTTLKPIHVP